MDPFTAAPNPGINFKSCFAVSLNNCAPIPIPSTLTMNFSAAFTDKSSPEI